MTAWRRENTGELAAFERIMSHCESRVLRVALRTSSVQPGIPGTSAGIWSFISEMVKDTFVPGAIGGPWQWFPSGDAEYAYSAPPVALDWLALIVAVAVVAGSIWSRRYAWRSWAILAAWLAAADIAPVLLGRISELGPTVLGLETRYVADAVPVLAICVGLAFFPVAGNRAYIARRQAPVSQGLSHAVGQGVDQATSRASWPRRGRARLAPTSPVRSRCSMPAEYWASSRIPGRQCSMPWRARRGPSGNSRQCAPPTAGASPRRCDGSVVSFQSSVRACETDN